MFASIDLLGPKEKILSFVQKCQNILWTLIVCSMTIFMFDKTRKDRPKPILHLKTFAFYFSRLCVFNKLLGPKNCSYRFPTCYQVSLWTPLKYSLMFVTLDDTMKNGPKTLGVVKTALFWKVCFYRPIRSKRFVLIKRRKVFKLPCGPFLFLPCYFLCSIKRERIGQNFFFNGRVAYFSKLCVFNNLLGPQKKLL